ncbi:enoyl-CoA hydratase/isomerase family protein [Paenarthrobacter ureafaciens]|jgi:enoyl-CoA hydratase/carnithine racemase|uniref:enoyl-CoA hydratase/isomerase family protein n=1 Tax=Paenarthrobacter ureafaciens TaxID=37931 RepID=UPI001C2C494D|nr:enoyl-CoA hydratase/isomerase family protein [Paenarthrobacter ureafaciens]
MFESSTLIHTSTEPTEVTDEPVLQVVDSGAVRILMMNRPEKLNALNSELTQALVDALTEADASERVRAVVLGGRGRGFCAGADLSEFAELTPAQQEKVSKRADLTARLQTLPQQMSKPIISVVQGPAVGGGAGLAIGCDMMVAADTLKFGYPEIKHSIVPALVMTGMQRQIGRKLAFELISTGRLLSAQEVHDIGLANEICPAKDALQRGIDIATTWAEATPAAMRSIKELFYRVADLPFEAAMRAGRDVNTIMRGFREDRP